MIILAVDAPIGESTENIHKVSACMALQGNYIQGLCQKFLIGESKRGGGLRILEILKDP